MIWFYFWIGKYRRPYLLPYPFLGFCWKWLHVELSEALHICFPFYTQPQVYVKTTTTNLRIYGKVAYDCERGVGNWKILVILNFESLLGPRIEK